MRLNPTVAEVGRNFSDYIDRVVRRGERFLLVEGSEAVAELRPVAPVRRLGELPAILAALPRLSPEELDSFEADLAAGREEMRSLPTHDPWES